MGLKAGETVPFDAQCSTPELAARVAVKAHQCSELVKLRVEEKQKLCDVDISLLRQKQAIENERHDGQMDILKDRLEDATAWYRSPVFVATVTVILTAGAMLGARKLIVETQ